MHILKLKNIYAKIEKYCWKKSLLGLVFWIGVVGRMTSSPRILATDLCSCIEYVLICAFQMTILEEGPQAFETLNGNRDFDDSPLLQLLEQMSL